MGLALRFGACFNAVAGKEQDRLPEGSASLAARLPVKAKATAPTLVISPTDSAQEA